MPSTTHLSSAVQVRLVPLALRPGLLYAYVIVGRNGDAVLVDTGYPGDADRILELVRHGGVDPGRIALILCTHAHSDHSGSAAALRRRIGAPIAIHRADAALLSRGAEAPMVPRNRGGRFFLRYIQKTYDLDPCAPDLVLGDRCSLRRYGVDAEVVHTPGHTPGSVSICGIGGSGGRGGLALVGDLVIRGWTRARPTWHFFASDAAAMQASLARVLDTGPIRVYAAHGGPFEPARLHALLERSNR